MFMSLRSIFVLVLGTIFLIPCSAQKQHGKASYYSKKITGAKTASGQRLHHDSLVCAHRSYPFGTHLKVTNLSNNKTVIVKVIDRGPFGRGRIIDLSWAAAKKIGMINQGVASVKVELMENPIPYRPEEAKLPRIEFDVAESDFKWYPKENHKKEITNYINSIKKEREIDKENRKETHQSRQHNKEHKPNEKDKEHKVSEKSKELHVTSKDKQETKNKN